MEVIDFNRRQGSAAKPQKIGTINHKERKDHKKNLESGFSTPGKKAKDARSEGGFEHAAVDAVCAGIRFGAGGKFAIG
jgi:hypothetical protein